MESLETLKRRIDTAQDLHSLVRTMKAMAAVNIRQLEHALASLVEYEQNVELALRAILGGSARRTVTARSAANESLGVIVFGSDQGMCGGLNDQVTEFARTTIQSVRNNGDLAILAVGGRLDSRLKHAGLPVESVVSVASSINGVTPLVQDLLLHIDRWHSDRRIERIVVLFCEHISRGAYETKRLDLLPVDREWLAKTQQREWPSNGLPSYSIDVDRLFSRLIRQYLFVSLYRAAAESLASENAARLAAMRGAERNISDRLDELRSHFQQVRQTTITEELLDIVSGFEALNGTD